MKNAFQVAKRGEHFGQLYNQLDRCGDVCKWILSRIQDNEKIWQRSYDKLFHHDEIEITDLNGTVYHLPRKKDIWVTKHSRKKNDKIFNFSPTPFFQ